MCGRFEAFTYEEVAAVVAAVEGRAAIHGGFEAEAPRAQARPGSSVLLFGHGAEDEDDHLEIAEATWGFDAPWSTRPVFNTRIESAVDGTPFWRDPVRDGRCIIPAAAFFEPHATETVRNPRTGRPMKRAYRFALPDDEPLLMAGVQADGRCSVVTCEPNQWVRPVHNRMPLILRFEEALSWLSPDWASLADRSHLQLTATPEHLDFPEEPTQLSLF